jgi:hypothetical protein
MHTTEHGAIHWLATNIVLIVSHERCIWVADIEAMEREWATILEYEVVYPPHLQSERVHCIVVESIPHWWAGRGSCSGCGGGYIRGGNCR